jgi:hypothetical protein
MGEKSPRRIQASELGDHMNEFMNWNDTSILLQYNWFWLAVAFALGAWIGFRTCQPAHYEDK